MDNVNHYGITTQHVCRGEWGCKKYLLSKSENKQTFD